MARSFVIIGLSTLGVEAAKALYHAGADVLAMDRRQDLVDDIAAHVTRAVVADATDERAMKAVGAFDCDAAIVALRHHFDASILVTHLFRQRGMKEIVVRVNTEMEAGAVRAVGATQVLFPDRDVGLRLAQHMLSPNLTDQLPLGQDYGIAEVPLPPRLAGKTIIDLDIRRSHGVHVIAVKRPPEKATDEPQVTIAPEPAVPLKAGEVLVLLGETRRLLRFSDQMNEA